jgi:hypothetical protein
MHDPQSTKEIVHGGTPGNGLDGTIQPDPKTLASGKQTPSRRLIFVKRSGGGFALMAQILG